MRIFRPPHLLVYSVHAAAAGLFFAFAFPPKLIPGIEFVALVPVLLLLLAPLPRNRQLFFLGWVSGTTAFVVYLRWFFDILPLSWLDLPTDASIVGVVAVTLFLAAGYFGLWFGLFLVLIKKYACKNALRFSLAILLVWPIMEYLRTFFFSFHPYLQGPGWLWGPHAAFMLLGYALAPYALLRSLASILGTYGLSIVVLIPNVALFLIIANYKKDAPGEHEHPLACTTRLSLMKTLATLALLFLVFLAHGFWLSSHHPDPVKTKTVKIALIQTAFETHGPETDEIAFQKRKKEKDAVMVGLIAHALKSDPDLIVVPEGTPSIFTERDFEPYPSFEEIVGKLGKERYRVAIDTGFPSRKWDLHKNSTTVFDNRTGVLGTYQKQFLMPWGEYVPYVTEWISRMQKFSWNDVILPFTPGNKPGVFETELGNVGILTCSEILSPHLTNKTARSGASILIFSSSDAVLHRSKQIQEQNLAMAQIRAAATRKPLIYSANESRSFALDALGNIIWQSEGIKNESIVIPIETKSERTMGVYLP